MYRKINFNHLEVFYCLGQTLSFTRCSEILNKAQPAITKQIQALEADLETQLFIRSNKGVILTPKGELLFQKTHGLYHEICNRIGEFRQESEDLSGDITFGCLSEIGERVFIFAINKFIKKYPGVRVNIKYLKTDEIISGIKLGQIDIGIIVQNILRENIRTYNIFEEDIILVTSRKNYSGKIETMEELPILTYREQDPLLNFYLSHVFPKINKKHLKYFMQVNSHKSMIEVLKSNKCMAVLPKLSIKSQLDKAQLIDIGPKKLNSNLYLIQLEQEYMDKAVKELSDYLRDYIKTI
jgi:DNA-binding transcriptional LysR family regulator